METKRLRIYAGPNGSGKSVLHKKLSHVVKNGPFVNADLIYKGLDGNGYYDFNDLDIFIEDTLWQSFIVNHGLFEQCSAMKQCKVTHNILTSDNNFNSYDTAVLASFIRNQMIVQGISFSCETVFSHEGKLDLIKEATKHNYRTYLYFCCAGDADTCVERVKQRVEEGGHDVPVEKIKGRFSRTLENLRPALSLVNRAYLFDNSGKEFELIVEKEEHKIEIKTSSVPNWISKYLLEKLND